MKKQAVLALGLVATGILAVSVSCSTGSMGGRSVASTTAQQQTLDAIHPALPLDEVPTPEQLYLNGNFLVKAPSDLGWSENHYGHPLGLSMRRPAVNLAGTIFEKKYGKPGSKLIGNFYHEGQFYIVRVPEHAVQNIYFQIYYFPPLVFGHYIAAHSLLRFELDGDHPVEVAATMPTLDDLAKIRAASGENQLALLPDESPLPHQQFKNVLLSGEAQPAADDPKQSYDLIRGEKGAYIIVDRFEAMEDRMEYFYTNGTPVHQIELDPTHGKYDPDYLLALGLAMSQHDGINNIYDTLNYNCATFAFDIIETGENEHDNRLDFIASFIETRDAAFSTKKVEYLGGIDAQPTYTDKSLKEDSAEAYKRIVLDTKRPLCPKGMLPNSCDNLNKAVAALKE